MNKKMRTVDKKLFFEFITERESPVALSSIPESLLSDIEEYLFGRTVIKKNGGIAFYPGDFNDWIAKLKTEGLDYDIRLI